MSRTSLPPMPSNLDDDQAAAFCRWMESRPRCTHVNSLKMHQPLKCTREMGHPGAHATVVVTEARFEVIEWPTAAGTFRVEIIPMP